jgi:hypothetical protein
MMRSRYVIQCILTAVFLSHTLAFATVVPEKKSALDPETKVSISVFDLLKRKGKTAMSDVTTLQRKYVEQVLGQVRGQREKILACLMNSSKISIQLRLEIEPSGSATATVLNSNNGAAVCSAEILGDLHYLPHKLAGKVEIEFPLDLERRSF